MAQTVTIKGLTLGSPRPAVIVPIAMRTEREIIEQAHAIADSPQSHHVDLVEWRIDHFEACSNSDYDAVVSVLHELQRVLMPRPILATFRTQYEGGASVISDSNYLELNSKLSTGGADVIDIEAHHPKASDCIAAAHQESVPVVGSNHDFNSTPRHHDIVATLKHIRSLGCDVPKIAVTPKTPADTLTLLSASLEASEQIDAPIITISMQSLGLASRLCGGTFGSAATFATLGEESAPGQVPVELVAAALDSAHGNNEN